MRLHQVSYRMQAHKETGQAVGAEALAGLAGFAPPTLHSLGARVASGLSKRWFNLVVTNVPGPQQPLYAGDARMLAAYPVVPLAKGQALSIGLTSYDGRRLLRPERRPRRDARRRRARAVPRGRPRRAPGDGAMTPPGHVRAPGTPRRGLVLGAGGVLGAAWTIGALDALAEVEGFEPHTATSSSARRPARCWPRCSAPG